MRIAICDDDVGCGSQLNDWLQSIGKMDMMEMCVTTYTNAEQLVMQMNRGEWYDVIFLDIELPGLSGVEVGQAIRGHMQNDSVAIIFISGKTRYCLELFELEPTNFHLKPLNREKIYADIKKVAKRIQESRNSYQYIEDGVPRAIAVADIRCVIARNKELEIIVENQKKICVRESITNLSEKFADSPVFQCHRAYMVNCHYVNRYLNRCLYLQDGTEIPVGKKYQKQVKERLLYAAKEIW